MTERLYYNDAYLWEFDAKITRMRDRSCLWRTIFRSLISSLACA